MSELKSCVAPLIQSYIDFKRGIGYKYSNAYHLEMFDRLLFEKGCNSLTISKDVIEEWCSKKYYEGEINRYKRINDIRNFLIYLNNMGYENYVPRLPKNHKTTFVPHIFTKDEIEHFFHVCDRFENKPSFQSCQNIYPALFRLLYGCGLRVNEALSLKNDDVNLEEKFIIIRESKNGTDRKLPLSDSLAVVLKQYQNSYREKNKTGEYFFVKQNGLPCSSDAVYRQFRRIIYRANISHGGKGQGPRVHDWRHSFCVHSLAVMAENGLDLYYCLPLLSKYLGHGSLEATDKYVRLTEEMYSHLLKDVDNICSYVFPEVRRP